jgi:hypothetical protein
MPKTLRALQDWSPRFHLPPAEIPSELINQFQKVRLLLAADSLAPPENVSLEDLHTRLTQISKEKGSLSALTKRELRSSAWLLFSTKYGERLSDRKTFLKEFLMSAHRRIGSKGTIATVCAFLSDYPNDAKNFKLILRWLNQITERISEERYIAVKQKILNGHLLKEDGPAYIAGLLMKLPSREGMDLFLENHLLTGERGTAGFIKEVFREQQPLCRVALQNRPIDRKPVERFIELGFIDRDGVLEFRFPGSRAEIAQALLQPLASSDPLKSERDFLKDFLLKHYGDPRTQIGKWQGVSADARQVMIGWLVENTFEDFMRIVDLTQATDDDADRQWPYRKAFWLAYLRQGHIDDAWLVLAYEIEQRAQQKLGIKRGTYAKIAGNGVRQSHAVLIIQIGDQIITEWSHMGKFRVWNMNDRSAPRLHLARYDRDSVTKSPRFEESHMGAENGRWQEKLEQYLWRFTKIRIPRSQYMPRR